MTSLQTAVKDFILLLTEGRSLEAMERYYADDVVVFENRELARAGRAKCLAYERAALATQPTAPRFKLQKYAIDDATGHVFLEYVVRFHSPERRPMRLEEVAVQTWSGERIVEERFYYEGVVDEGDDGDEGAEPLP